MNNPSPLEVDQLFVGIADTDQQWGPFLFLRPRPAEQFGALRVLALSVLVGGAFGLPGSIFLALLARSAHRPALPVYVFPLVLTVLYCCLCQLTFVPAWNRRAQRLAKRL